MVRRHKGEEIVLMISTEEFCESHPKQEFVVIWSMLYYLSTVVDHVNRVVDQRHRTYLSSQLLDARHVQGFVVILIRISVLLKAAKSARSDVVMNSQAENVTILA